MNTSEANSSTSSTEYGLNYWAAQTLKTRRFQYTYVHVGARKPSRYEPCEYQINGITFSYSSYGRSLGLGGHKYKVRARYIDTNKPVPSKVLKSLYSSIL